MKKKVLALVVLAAMLVSILPFAAFADVDAASSRVIVSTDKADADGKDEVELDILLKGAVGETTLYVYSSRGSADTFYEEEVTADNKVPGSGYIRRVAFGQFRLRRMRAAGPV